jgi:hypothetical protein
MPSADDYPLPDITLQKRLREMRLMQKQGEVVGGFRDYSPWWYWQTEYEQNTHRYYVPDRGDVKHPHINKFEQGTQVCMCCDNINYTFGGVLSDGENSLCKQCQSIAPCQMSLYRRDLLADAHQKRLATLRALPRRIALLTTAQLREDAVHLVIPSNAD